MNIVFSRTEIESLLVDIYRLTNHQLALFDSAGTLLCRYPPIFPAICGELQGIPAGKARCEKCDRLGIEKARMEMDVIVHTCHAGLKEIFVPIIDSLDNLTTNLKKGNEIIGFWAIGHLIPESENMNHTWEAICMNCGDIMPNITTMFDQFINLKPVSEDYIKALCNTLRMCVQFIVFSRMFILQRSPLWENFTRFISENLDKPLNVNEIANTLSVSKSTLIRCSVTNAGISVGKFIKNKRMKLASDLLRNTDLSVSAVAIKCGMEDYNYFSRAFKNHFGTTPLKYKKQTRYLK